MTCQSEHAPQPAPGCTALTWYTPWDSARIRVIAWTCDCLPVVYELCQVGGQGFIRRTVQGEGSPEIRETQRWHVAEAYHVWSAILSGMAR